MVGNHIDGMTKNSLTQTPNPSVEFLNSTPLAKFTNPSSLVDPSSGSVVDLQKNYYLFKHCFNLHRSRKNLIYLDTTDFINFIEKTRVKNRTFLVSMDLTGLYTNIPQKEGIKTV